MKIPQWLLRLLNRKYQPRQVLSEKELEVLDRLDTYLTSLSATVQLDSVMVLKSAEINLFYAAKDVDAIVKAVLTKVPFGFSYVPRSIAFFVDEQGSWCYLIAVRGIGEVDPLATKMFTQLLARTNDARSKFK